MSSFFRVVDCHKFLLARVLANSLYMTYIVYGKEGCLDCRRARKYLEQSGKAFEFVDVDTDVGMKRYITTQHYLSVPQSTTTWPRVFQRNMFVGGVSELQIFLGISDNTCVAKHLPPIPFTSYADDWPNLGKPFSESEISKCTPPIVDGAEILPNIDDGVPPVPAQAEFFDNIF